MKKYLGIIFAAVVALPVGAIAQNKDLVISNDEVAYASVFAGDFSLLLSIVIGIFASFFVLRAASRMGGGLFGSVLNYIGAGMISVVLGTISVTVATWFNPVWSSIINTTFFALGYIFMVIGANKLLKGILTN